MESVKVLNPVLYSLLVQCFGHVTIANHGERSALRQVRDPVSGHSRWTGKAGERYVVSCPKCGPVKGKSKLEISHLFADPTAMATLGAAYTNKHAFCQRTQGRCYDTSEERQELFDSIMAGTKLSRERGFSPQAEQLGEDESFVQELTPLPPDLTPVNALPRTHPAAAWLAARGFNLDELSGLGVGYTARGAPVRKPGGHKWSGANRIVAPIHKDGKYAGWQGRWFEDDESPRPKWLTSTGSKLSELLYNFDHVARAKPPTIVVVEGPKDVWGVGPQAVALFRCAICPPQCRLLARLAETGCSCVLALDADVWKPKEENQATQQRRARAMAAVADLRRVFDGKFLDFRLGAKSPGDYDRGWFLSAVEAAAAAAGVSVDFSHTRGLVPGQWTL